MTVIAMSDKELDRMQVLRDLSTKQITVSDTDSGRWTRIEDSCVVGARIGWCAVSRGGEAWRGLLLI